MRTFLSLLFACLLCRGYAQDADLIGYKGGYKALSRLCEQNLDQASHLLANDYSRGYFVSLTIQPGTDTVSDISFLTATPPDMQAQIAWAMKTTNGQWMARSTPRKFLVPIFFCQNTPPNEAFFSQVLVTNNVGFSVDHFPDQWPEAAEGVWLHPLCPMVSSGAARPAPPTAGSGTASAATTAAATTTAATTAPPAAAPPPTTGATAQSTQPNGWPVKVETPSPASSTTTTMDTLSPSGVYQSPEQFSRGAVTFGSPTAVEQKGLLSWYAIDYAAFGQVRVRSANKDYQEFPLGSLYGFRSVGVDFLYLKSQKQYYSVISKGAPFFLLMDERKESGYNGASTIDGIFMYAKTIDGPVREFTKKNIDNDFGSNPQEAGDLQVLRKEMNRHCISMSRGDFEACKELAKDYLLKWK